MKKRVLAIILVIVVLTMSGCGRAMYAPTEDVSVAEEPAVEEELVAEEPVYESEVLVEEAPAEEAATAYNNHASSADTLLTEKMPISNRKFIKTLDVDMQTTDFDETISSITAMVNELGGYIEQSNISGNHLSYEDNYSDYEYNPRNANYVLRIPVDRLDTVADKLGTLGNITNRSESVEDVTANYTDIELRLKTLRVQEERLLEILKNADELEYIITLETELSNVCYEIESYTSKLNGLDNKISYSFVNINVSEVIEYEKVIVAPPTFGTRIADGFSKSIRAIADLGQTLVITFVTIVPFLVVWGGIITLLIVGILKGKKIYRQKHPKGVDMQKKSESISEAEQEKTNPKA